MSDIRTFGSTDFGSDNEPFTDSSDATDEPIEAVADEGLEPDDVSGASAKRKPKAGGISKAQVRKIVTKALEVEITSSDTRHLAASVLGISNDTTDLVAAIFANSKGASAVFDDINEIVEADLMEVAIIAASLGRERMKAVWKVLTILEAATSPLHASDAKAGLAIAKAVKSLNNEQTGALSDTSDLLTIR